MNFRLPLGVIGAGPKAAALAAKSSALRDEGFDVPKILIVERHKIAASWDGKHGYTSGLQRLGTPPEKDVGFPYSTTSCAPQVVNRVFRDFSWMSYLINDVEELGNWIDKGRPHPTHEEWAAYIRWAIARSDAEVVIDELCGIVQEDFGWKLVVGRGKNKKTFEVCGLVITGPGPSKVPVNLPNHERILYGDSFWEKRKILNKIRHVDDDADPIAVVGSGETAASIVSYLVEEFGEEYKVVVLTRSSGTIFSRGEGYYENRMFTAYGTWLELDESLRLEIIERSDRGVISPDAIKKIALSRNVDHWAMSVETVSVSPADHTKVVINGEQSCQLLVFATGFDAYWFKDLLDEDLRTVFNNDLEVRRAVAHDLSLHHNGIKSKLHLPMIAGLAQGPGYPNLSCLGSLSDRILGSYLGGAKTAP